MDIGDPAKARAVTLKWLDEDGPPPAGHMCLLFPDDTERVERLKKKFFLSPDPTIDRLSNMAIREMLECQKEDLSKELADNVATRAQQKAAAEAFAQLQEFQKDGRRVAIANIKERVETWREDAEAQALSLLEKNCAAPFNSHRRSAIQLATLMCVLEKYDPKAPWYWNPADDPRKIPEDDPRPHKKDSSKCSITADTFCRFLRDKFPFPYRPSR